MSHPLIGTDWVDPSGSMAPFSISSEADFKANWQMLNANYIPAKDYIFKYSTNASEYLLVGILTVNKGQFYNINKNNAIKLLPFSVADLIPKRADPHSGLVNSPVGTSASTQGPIVITKTMKAAAQTQKIISPSTPTGFSTSTAGFSGSTSIKIPMKITTPKRKCEQCGGTMSLLFAFFSCDNGCR